MGFKKGCISWNTGLTTETSLKLAEAGKKIREKNKGCIPWNKGKKGLQVAWNKGLTKETSPLVAKYAKNLKGQSRPPRSKKWRERQSKSVSGKNNPRARWLKLSKEEARKIFDDYKKSQLNINAFAKTLKGEAGKISELFKRFFPAEYIDFVETKQSRKVSMYKRGRAFEYRVRNHFIAKGYFVLRSPRSKGPADLVAIKKGEILLIQCKLGQNFLRRKEKKILVDLAESLDAIPLLTYRERHKVKTLDLRTLD